MLQADVTDQESIDAAVGQVIQRFGQLDLVINNAGIGSVGTVEDNGDDEWNRVFDVNVLGIVRTSRAVLPHLRRSASPAIVNVSSIAAIRRPRRQSVLQRQQGCRAVPHSGDGGGSAQRRDPGELRDPRHRRHPLGGSPSRSDVEPGRSAAVSRTAPAHGTLGDG